MAKASTSEAVFAWLRDYECRNITYVDPSGGWPIVWDRAHGLNVWDLEGRKYLDLTAAFGVAAAGHANPRVVRAGSQQMGRLLHAMGDVHPHELKARLARDLSRLTFERWGRIRGRPKLVLPGPIAGKTIFCNSGFEAVEAALKTALLATGKQGVIAFEGGYHGLGYGALNATHRTHFRDPFRRQLREFGYFVPFPTEPGELSALSEKIRRLFRTRTVGAILLEPVQVRGGIHIPPPQFLSMLRELCDENDALLILDEIYTGFGRTGKWFACEHWTIVPDLICLGKALTGGFPLSACVGKATLMDLAWPLSSGEAIHTSTYLGHPVGCAMALAQIREIRERDLVTRSARSGLRLLHWLNSFPSVTKFQFSPRGLGLLAGLEVRHRDGSPATSIVLSVVKEALKRGFVFLPEGGSSEVISLTPPLTISEAALRSAVKTLGCVLVEACSAGESES